MDQQKIDMFMLANQKYFPADKLMFVREKLEHTTPEKFNLISALNFKNPTVLTVVSVLIGAWGIDRFMLGDIGMGVLKLLTGGCCGILTIIDWFTISKKAKERNFVALMTLI